jgi:hypothetical protein
MIDDASLSSGIHLLMCLDLVGTFLKLLYKNYMDTVTCLLSHMLNILSFMSPDVGISIILFILT